MKNFILLFLWSPIILQAQKGIKFEHNKTWGELIEQAKTENKYIFVDAFATWCGPCKYMSANIFTKDEVGELYNSSFINVKMQMDTSSKDNEWVKKWYATAHDMGKKYGIAAYPTFLFFRSDGTIVHRLVGSMEADVFINKTKFLLEPENQYYSMVDRYRNGQKDADFLKKLANAAEEAFDSEIITQVGNDYLSTQTNFLTEENLDFIFRFTNSSKDKGFSVLLNNESQINKKQENTVATEKLIEIITREEITPFLKRKGPKGPDWKMINMLLTKKYPNQQGEVLLNGKLTYYQKTKDWINFGVVVQQYMQKYGQKATPAQLNSFAWTVFENCKDKSLIASALDWSRKACETLPDPAFLDTYANLLYKSGKREDAIIWEQKAMMQAGEEEKEDYNIAIEKMKKGEKTWKE